LFVVLSIYSHAYQSNELKNVTNPNDIVQDQQGYIWLAGQHGLSRFDGNKLSSFNAHSSFWLTPFNWTHDLHLVNDQILVSTENNGVWLINSKTGESTALKADIESGSVYQASFFKGHYYIYTVSPKSLYRFNPHTSVTTLINKDFHINKFVQTESALYFYNNQGVFEVKNDVITPLLLAPIESAATDANTLIFASKDTLYRYQNNVQLLKSTVDEEIIELTFENNSENIFAINSKNSIKKYDSNFQPLAHNYATTQKAKTKKIFHDESNTLWLLSSSGANRLTFNNIKNTLKTFDTSINKINIEAFNNDIIIGSYGAGLHTLTNKNEQNSSVASPTIPTKVNQQFSAAGLLIMDLLTIGNDLYIATFDGLWHYHLESQQLVKLQIKNNNKILLRIIHKNNSLYVATDQNGFFIYDLKTKKVTLIVDEQQPLSSPEVIDILPLENNTTWLATAKHIDIYHHNSKTIESIEVAGSSKVLSLVYANNKIYAATKGDGIFVYGKDKALLARFAVGIDFEKINLINGELWASSRQGLYRISPEDNHMTMVPGTEQYAFSDEAILHNGTLYIGHYEGVLAVPLASKKQYHAKVHISKTTVSGKSYLLNRAIKNATSNDVITFDLASLDYRSGQEKQYKYQINSSKWHPVNGNQITLTGLASGNYQIAIMGTNSLGQWSNFKAFTQINVAYPWYWTPQIRLLYVFTIVGLFMFILWLLYLRGKSIKYIHQTLLNDMKTSNNVTLNISRNLSTAIELCSNIEEKLAIEDKANQEAIKQLLQKSLYELNHQSQQQDPNSLDGNKLSIALPFLIEFIAKKYQLKVHSQFDLNEKELSYELQADIYSIIYQALTSAILNDKGGSFAVALNQKNNKVWLTINDDANSFTQFGSKINFDRAMYTIRQIANKYNATVNTFKEPLQGSQLVIGIPIKRFS